MGGQAAGRPCGKKCVDRRRCDKSPGGCVLGRGQTITLSNMVDYEVWQPTLELRYIRRETKPGWFVTTLQQRWERLSPCVGSAWHDIPTVTEEEQG
jgi:hypothetical protein